MGQATRSLFATVTLGCLYLIFKLCCFVNLHHKLLTGLGNRRAAYQTHLCKCFRFNDTLLFRYISLYSRSLLKTPFILVLFALLPRAGRDLFPCNLSFQGKRSLSWIRMACSLTLPSALSYHRQAYPLCQEG